VPVEPSNLTPWSDEDVEQLLRLIESGSSLAELSRALGRSEYDVEQQAQFLGVLIPRHEELAVQTRTADSSSISATIHYAPFATGSRRATV
jgi:hypothetical protein